MAREFKPQEVIFTITAEQEDLPIRGNAIASGDEDFDEKIAREIEADLDRGNVWAWASVTVTASWAGFAGNDQLGGCSYKDEDDFRKAGGYFEDMLRESVRQLVEEIRGNGWGVLADETAMDATVRRELGE